MKFLQSACLAASLLLASSAVAAPVAKRQNVGARKRIALWEWTLTRDYQFYPGIQETAASLAWSPELAGVMNWETWTPTEVPLAHEPMVRTPAQLVGDAWSQIVGTLQNQQQSGMAPLVHFYNEPERQGIAPAEAAAVWRNSLLPLRALFGARLVGPAAASDPAGTEWLREFMSYLGDGEKPDYTGVHFYTSQWTPSSEEVVYAQDHIRGRHDEYGLGVVVSEIASTNRDYNEVDYFTRSMAQWMDGESWVHQYGFFGMSREPVDDFVSPAAQLLDINGYLTPLGRFIAGFE
ncbi:hypothetical protein DL764_003598 [Monosporascus ibericus]|uniref:Asl1-like glycosyl hydrolase catalytic domain-containing protein n=1 Tax=Monosporascus ibericus TaxID=155417 RepID=A0A4Q4TJH5_9PEZI|nr:hypothetical protein DL764_003598 [Monosporascus ibericus]